MLYAPHGVFVCKKLLEPYDSQGRTPLPKSERDHAEMIYITRLNAYQKSYGYLNSGLLALAASADQFW